MTELGDRHAPVSVIAMGGIRTVRADASLVVSWKHLLECCLMAGTLFDDRRNVSAGLLRS
jgi:hypothetical protein